MFFLLGLGLGYGIGLLIAPASGEEFRQHLAERADDYGRQKAREIGQQAGEKAYEQLKQRL
ncbi:MAG TPA: YtxH domain-containing protein [Terriglobales bacterium]|nr:YtxH domain-containing protein [Terriglobales bacterium]